MNNISKGVRVAFGAQRSMPLRILWATGTYFPDIGGAEWSAMANVSLLKEQFGHIILVGAGHGARVIDGVPVFECRDKVDEEINTAIRDFDPHFIAAQGFYAKTALERSLENDRIAVYFLRAETTMDFSDFIVNPRFRVVANSEWMCEWFSQAWGVKPIQLYPIVLPWLVVDKEHECGDYVAHVGDANVKGGTRVLEIAKRLPAISFLVTRSWPALRTGDNWRADRIQQLQSCDGSKTSFETNITNYSETPNVKVISPLLAPCAFYQKTRLLLVASKWREPYGRVVIEALLNGLPVIISPEVHNEAWSDMVYKVKDGDDIEEWVALIEYLLINGLDQDRAKAIEAFRLSFSNENNVQILMHDIFY